MIVLRRIVMPNHYDVLVMAIPLILYGNALVSRGWDYLIAYLAVAFFLITALAVVKLLSLLVVIGTRSAILKLLIATTSSAIGLFLFIATSTAVGLEVTGTIDLYEWILAVVLFIRIYVFDREARGKTD